MPSTPPSQGPRAAQGAFLPLALALLGVIAGFSAIYAINPRFFFIDDRQAQYFPYGLIIRDMLLHGQFPFITTRSFFGGALWLDPQNAIYNPFSLLMDLLINPAHLQFSGLIFAIAMNLLLAGGGYALGRAYRLPPGMAALLGFMMATNLYLLYFHSADWHPGVTALAWLLFAWAAMKRLIEAESGIARLIFIAAAFIYLSVSSGWPHEDVALAVVMSVLFISEAKQSPRRALRLAWTGALAVALCLPVIVPVLMALPWTARESGLAHNGLFAPTLTQILNFSNPAWRPQVALFRPDQIIPFPFFFLAWYALPLAAFIDFRAIKWPKALLAMTGIFVFLATCTGQIGPLRFPMRWLPDVHLGLLLTLFVILQQAGAVVAPRRTLLAFGILAATTLFALVDNRAEAINAMRLVLLAAVFVAMLPEMLARPAWLPLFLGATSLALTLIMVSAFPVIFDDLGKDNSAPVTAAAHDLNAAGYTLYSGSTAVLRGRGGREDYLPAAMGAYYGVHVINGYSSLAHKDWNGIFGCAGYETARCGFPVPPLLRKGAETKATYLDLLKITGIVAEKGPPAKLAVKVLSHGWVRRDELHTIHFIRRPAARLPGTVSWHSPSVSVQRSDEAHGNTETEKIVNGNDAALIVFARPYYPGFQAFLDKQPLTVREVDGLFIGVDIPPHAAGELRLTFQPPWFVRSILAAACGLLCLLAAGFFEKRGSLKI